MKPELLKFSIYPVLFINVVIGVAMILGTHTFILILVSRLNQIGFFDNMNIGVFSGIQQVASILGIVVLALIALIAFPLIERYYSKSIEKDVYRKRVLQIIGIQLFYWGIIQLITRLIAGTRTSVSSWLWLVIGVSLILIANRMFQAQSDVTETS